MKTIIFFFCICSIGSISAFSQSDIMNSADRNKSVLDTVVKYGPTISPTYRKAVCTEMVIKVLEKFYPLNRTDKSRIRIITDDDIQLLLASDSPVPKGVYYSLTEKGIGIPIDNIQEVLPGDFVQFWTETWGHCGIVKSIDNMRNVMYFIFFISFYRWIWNTKVRHSPTLLFC